MRTIRATKPSRWSSTIHVSNGNLPACIVSRSRQEFLGWQWQIQDNLEVNCPDCLRLIAKGEIDV